MKKVFIFLFITMFFISCKRKQELSELNSDEVLAESPAQCYNGLQDSTESGIDCGGPCKPCNIITPTCTPIANSIKVRNK